MTATYADFIACPDREEIVLAEITPSESVAGWVAAGGGLTSTYKTAFAPFTLPNRVVGGLYRRVVGVRENATDLTERPSAAAVDATASSWYWDEVAGTLYVRSSTGSDPDLFTSYRVLATYYFASTGVVLDRIDGDASTGIYYQPWLLGDLPRLSQWIDDLVGGTKITEGGEISFNNAGHNAWTQLIPTLHWFNQRVQLYHGGKFHGQSLPRSQYALITTMLVEDLAADEEAATVTVKPRAQLLTRELPITPYVTSSYPNLGQGVKGTKKWLGWGRAVIAPDLTDTSSSGVWTVADAAKQTLFAVHTVRAIDKTTGVRTTLTPAIDYVVDLAGCTITVVNPSYRWQDYDVEVDVTGKPDGAGSYHKTFAQIYRDILKTFVHHADADLDLASFAQCDIDAPQELSLWIKSPRSIASILSSDQPGLPSLERSVLGRASESLAGQWIVEVFKPGTSTAALTKLRKQDFAVFRPKPDIRNLFWAVDVYYGQNHSSEEWAVESATDVRVQYETETTGQDPRPVYTFLRNQADAQVLAQRTLYLCGAAPLTAEFEERGTLLSRHRAGQRVLVTFDPAPVAGGALANSEMELLRLDRGLSPVLLIGGRLMENRAVGVGHWTGAGAPSYAAATLAQRSSQGFWSNSAGFVVPADPTTLRISRWW